MALLSSLSFLTRTHGSLNFFPKFLHKRTLCSSVNKILISRSYMSTSKTDALKSRIKFLLLVRPQVRYYSCLKKLDICEKRHAIFFEYLRLFHTSKPRYLHPVIWVVLRPVLKFVAIITGRAFRKWWRNLPPNKKEYFIERLKRNKRNIALFAITSVILSLIYYVNHIEETPITKRRRFMAFNSKQLEKLNQIEFLKIMKSMQSRILPDNHPETFRVKAVVNKILTANLDIKEVKSKKWGVAVINSSVENAFVLPIGYVFIFTGMLSLCRNDDELGIVLSHEIAHCILSHGAENISFTHLLDLISILIIGAIWAIIPSDSISLLTHWLYQRLLNIFFELPYNRSIETEADLVGLQLAAKACFDVRESSAFWSKMSVIKNNMGHGPEIEFLSTHPSHEKRSEYLDSIMDGALALRHECRCPKLKSTDPRLNTEVLAKALEASRRKYLEQYPKEVIIFKV